MRKCEDEVAILKPARGKKCNWTWVGVDGSCRLKAEWEERDD